MPSHLPPDFAPTHFLTKGTLARDLITSEHFDSRGRRLPRDLLEGRAWLIVWGTHWQLPLSSPPDTLALTALRALLCRMLVDLAMEQPISEAEELNTFLALTPVQPRVQQVPGGVRLVSIPLQVGWMGSVT